MKFEPLAIIACVVALLACGGMAMALHATGTPLESVGAVASLAIVILAQGVAALAGRTQVVSVNAAESVVKEALRTLPPSTEKQVTAQAEKMVASAKEIAKS